MTAHTLDTAVLQELADTTGTEFLVELVNTFLAEAPAMIAELSVAADAADADAFRRAAHSLKSNANTFGAYGLAALARELEISGPGATEDWQTTMDAEYRQAAAALEAYING